MLREQEILLIYCYALMAFLKKGQEGQENSQSYLIAQDRLAASYRAKYNFSPQISILCFVKT
ncbi:MAG: hypothetical protein CMR00_03625 [[Chlorobium] sp. 445]|nr:MAG: hypothetical protein CMR00_03625 [[Chlorobium] sp. 445]